MSKTLRKINAGHAAFTDRALTPDQGWSPNQHCQRVVSWEIEDKVWIIFDSLQIEGCFWCNVCVALCASAPISSGESLWWIVINKMESFKIQMSKNEANIKMRDETASNKSCQTYVWISPFLESLLMQMHVFWMSFIFQNVTCLEFFHI